MHPELYIFERKKGTERHIFRKNVVSSKNDCVDLSAGTYKLNKLRLVNCGDKGLSVGEKSLLQLD